MVAAVLHAEVSGPVGAPLVVLGGSLGSTMSMWDPQLPALAEHFRVVRYDARGHGRSPVPEGPYGLDDLVDDLLALLDRLELERVHLVGLSLGGMTAMRLAMREPGRVDRIAVLCTSARLGPASGWVERATQVRAGGTGSVADAVVARWFTEGFRQRRPEVVAKMVAMVAAVPAVGYAACCGAVAEMDLRDGLAAIRSPLLAIAGEHDPATPPEHLAAIASGVPDGRLVTLPEAAHLANVEQPAAVNALLLEHLRT